MKPLAEYAANVTSQAGEDGVLAELFRRIGPATRWCVEFGAWDGRRFSNTWSLVSSGQWKGVYIEADRRRFADLKASFRGNDNVVCINQFVSHEPGAVGLLDTLLATVSPLPAAFDLLSIDVDGNDYHIWDALRRYRPRVVVIENNPTVPPDVELIGPPGNTDVGSSAKALVKLGRSKGYELVAHTGVNCIFVEASEFPKAGVDNNDLEALFRKDHLRYVMSTWDGRLMIAGPLPYGCRVLRPRPLMRWAARGALNLLTGRRRTRVREIFGRISGTSARRKITTGILFVEERP